MDIKQSPSGAIVKAGTGYLAFIPHPLPPQFEWDVRLANSLSRADFLLGKLSREGSTLPNPHLLINPFVTREAVLSSRIEGTQATLEDMLADEAGAQIKRNPDDVQEVRNYIDALE
jgi:Fic family protein